MRPALSKPALLHHDLHGVPPGGARVETRLHLPAPLVEHVLYVRARLLEQFLVLANLN